MKTIPHHSNTERQKSTDELKAIMQDVLARARKIGATDASVAVSHDSGFSVDVRMGEVETVAFSEDKGVGLTVYIGHRSGSASSSDTSPKALDAMVTAAYEIAQVSAVDPCSGLPDRELVQFDYPNLDLFHPSLLTPTQAIETALQCEAQALSMDKRITNSDGVNISTYDFCHGFANSQGFMGVVDSSRHSMICSLLAQDGEKMQRDYEYTTARNIKDLWSGDKLASRAVEYTTGRIGAQKLKTQKTPVVFSNRISAGLFGALINAISGGNLYRKNSFLLDTVGQQIFPKEIQVYEQPHLLSALGSSPFDGEGIITRPNVIIKEGVLCQYVLGSYSARRLGLTTTANSGGVHNLTVNPTTGNLSDVLQKMDTGLFVTELMGSGINILTGDYSRGAMGFWVEKGQIQYPVEEITIAGNLREMFQNIVAVGTDINPNASMKCGSVLVSEMMIAGK